MLRKVWYIVAVAAILAIPFGDADARRGGGHFGGGHFGGGMRMGGGSIQHFSGARFSGVRVAPRRVFVAGPRVRHHRRIIYPVGFYDSCWRWRPTAYGWRYVWVCRPYPYTYY